MAVKLPKRMPVSLGQYRDAALKGRSPGKGHFKIRLQFDEFATRVVAERQWHASQRINSNGVAESTCRIIA